MENMGLSMASFLLSDFRTLFPSGKHPKKYPHKRVQSSLFRKQQKVSSDWIEDHADSETQSKGKRARLGWEQFRHVVEQHGEVETHD